MKTKLLASLEQQVNNVSGGQIFSDESNYVEIVCGPDNNSGPSNFRTSAYSFIFILDKSPPGKPLQCRE